MQKVNLIRESYQKPGAEVKEGDCKVAGSTPQIYNKNVGRKPSFGLSMLLLGHLTWQPTALHVRWEKYSGKKNITSDSKLRSRFVFFVFTFARGIKRKKKQLTILCTNLQWIQIKEWITFNMQNDLNCVLICDQIVNSCCKINNITHEEISEVMSFYFCSVLAAQISISTLTVTTCSQTLALPSPLQ